MQQLMSMTQNAVSPSEPHGPRLGEPLVQLGDINIQDGEAAHDVFDFASFQESGFGFGDHRICFMGSMFGGRSLRGRRTRPATPLLPRRRVP